MRSFSRFVIANDEARFVFCVVFFVDVKGRFAPMHVGGDGDIVRLFDPVFARVIDDWKRRVRSRIHAPT